MSGKVNCYPGGNPNPNELTNVVWSDEIRTGGESDERNFLVKTSVNYVRNYSPYKKACETVPVSTFTRTDDDEIAPRVMRLKENLQPVRKNIVTLTPGSSTSTSTVTNL
ncbi:hypothetical protein RUM44_010461 [Polyplax serrata]|uniref:Uncharacterized protein n=1 Tax=Polyplax serrata TaxID=468196 RepID=A0ABR1AVK8_POLSC